jgi:tritrans,polycis-undecaprenyl-diphosphate synthase [geranylgeranyl-diphosphate specific]
MNLNTILRALGVYRIYERYLKSQIKKGQAPEHVGIILDGNRRWAEEHSLPRWLGHRFGADVAEKILDWCHELGIKTVTLYALSKENLERRPPEELATLFQVIEDKLVKLLNDPRIHRYRIRVKGIGQLDRLPDRIQVLVRELEAATDGYDDHYLNIALAYGGRREIVDAVKAVASKVAEGQIRPEDIDEAVFEKHLYTAHLPNPEPDLIIRTSGEARLSGFLLYQSAYSELVFMDVYWPEFRKIDLMRAVRTYQKRHRRFGE